MKRARNVRAGMSVFQPIIHKPTFAIRSRQAMSYLKKTCAVIALLIASVCSANATTKFTYVYTDPQGTPLAEADESGNITATFDYKPYGEQAQGSSPAGPGYTGHVNDPDIGLVYMQARYYDPIVGRFLSMDPVALNGRNFFGFNRYAYGNNNPVMNIDPDGRYTCSQAGKTVSCKDAGVTKFVDGIRTAQASYSSKSASYITLGRVLAALGESDKAAPLSFELTTRPPNSPGGAPEGGTIQLDMKQLNASPPASYVAGNPGKPTEQVQMAIGAGAIAHEAQHEIDYLHGAFPANRSDEKSTEINAYTTESQVGRGLQINIGLNTRSDILNAAESSTVIWCAGNPTVPGC